MPNSASYLASFFGLDLTDTSNREYSHHIRWRTTSRTQRFFSSDLRQRLNGKNSMPTQEVYYPDGFDNWDALSQAQFLESSIFLPQYLLCSQGDRVAMAHSVEGRFPFLDYRVVEYCCKLPPELKLYGLKEKYLLRRLASKWLPEEIWNRPKRPYRAPIHRSFFRQDGAPDYVLELLSPASLEAAGIFSASSVQQMIQKLMAGKRLGETDDMALAGILSTQLVWQQFVKDFGARKPPPASLREVHRFYSGKKISLGA
jgi:asparagine synthase (glutamine-hydrolysing)